MPCGIALLFTFSVLRTLNVNKGAWTCRRGPDEMIMVTEHSLSRIENHLSGGPVMNQTSHTTAAPAAASPKEGDELTFRPSPQATLGVELELQIHDHDSGDLAPGAVPLLKICGEEGIQGATAELMQSMIEVKTRACINVNEVRSQLIPILRRGGKLGRAPRCKTGGARPHPPPPSHMSGGVSAERIRHP